MEIYVKVGCLKVSENLYNFINEEVLPDADLDSVKFWKDFENIINTLTPQNKLLLEKRERLQSEIYNWHKKNMNFNLEDYYSFLKEIGYIEKEVDDFTVQVSNVDEEIKDIAGPQLVVPINNPRYAINAANARWGSLYDAFYGTDIISEDGGADKGSGYNPVRATKVIQKSKEFLDEVFPLEDISYIDVTRVSVENGKMVCTYPNGITTLKDEGQFVGYQGELDNPKSILLKNNRLHIEIQFDESNPIGETDSANIKDILIESAITSIVDCEDSVTAVDAHDKVDVYQNWKGLIRGELTTSFKKGNQVIERTFNEDRIYTTPDEKTLTLSGRTLLLIRNVGHLMTSEAVLLADGTEAYEGILDGIITSAIAKQNLMGKGRHINSKSGSIYIVKPKMHGSEEVSFTDSLFRGIEDMLNLERYTIKIGIMDEERRTSLNLKNCISKVRNRVILINTGYLDRTGDEIHTSMIAGPMNRTDDMKHSAWYQSYEKNNVEIGLKLGLQNHAQIGKGMWAKPDEMAEMSKEKINQVLAGANTAWVPSPTAATIHALHYHQAFAPSIQEQLKNSITKKGYKRDIIQIPIENSFNWTNEEIKEEVDNHIQKILGYVVRWIEQGIGCSKVPNIQDIGMMEDRATLRISSQLVANWLYHGVCSKEDVEDAFYRLAKVVDEQNSEDPSYKNMAPEYEKSIAFQGAWELVFNALDQPNGYTEPILHRRRLEYKKKIKNN